MSYTLRSRTVARDNIASGSATGRENVLSGQAGSSPAYAGGELCRSTSGGATSVRQIEAHIAGTTPPTTENVVG